MKKVIYSLLAILLSINGWSQTLNFYSTYFKNGAYHFNDQLRVTRSNIFTTYKSEFGLSNNDEMVISQTIVEDGKVRTEFTQHHKGYRVEGGMMNAIGYYDIVKFANGNLIKNLNVNVANPIDEENALTNALNSINASVYDWQDYDREESIREEEEKPTYSSYPKGTLFIAQGSATSANPDQYKLVWVFQINSLVPLSHNTVYVDALTGNVLYNKNTEDNYIYCNTASGWTWYDGQFSDMRTRRCQGCTNWRLNDGKISTWSNNYTYPDNNNTWVENSYLGYQQRQTAHSAHWAAQKAWDYYLNVHGRWGSNYNGKELRIWPRTSNNNKVATYGIDANDVDVISLRGDNLNATQPSGTNPGVGYSVAQLDVIAHEYTHAMIRRSSGLNNFGDAGALNEGIADIFGMLIEKYVKGTIDWSIGEKMGLVRYANDPSLDYHMGGAQANIYSHTPSPSSYFGTYWQNSLYNNGAIPINGLDDETAHRNSGVLRKWFYLLANGGTFNNVTVPALGIDKARDILYISFNWWFWSNIKFTEAASQTANACIFSYGECSPEHKAVVKAWKAVGITVNNNCGLVRLNGPSVISSLVAENHEFSISNIADIDGQIQQIDWIVPADWTTTSDENSKLTFVATSTYESRELIANVIYNGNLVTVSKWVHFTNNNVAGDNKLPPSSKSDVSHDALNYEEDLVIYPNPAQDVVSVATHLSTDNAKINLYNLQGVLVKTINVSKEITAVDVSGLSMGIYVLEYKNNTISKHTKLIIKH